MIASVRTGDSGSDPELVGGLEASPGAQVVAPAALSDAGVGSVLAAAFGQVPDAGFARACMQATGGNPLFVREVAAALIADGIEPTADASERISAAAPQAIARFTLARLGRLSPDAVELARAIAVLGGDASLPRAASLAGLDEGHALAALDALVAADVVPAGPRARFSPPDRPQRDL